MIKVIEIRYYDWHWQRNGQYTSDCTQRPHDLAPDADRPANEKKLEPALPPLGENVRNPLPLRESSKPCRNRKEATQTRAGRDGKGGMQGRR